jgi:hypothetical protein
MDSNSGPQDGQGSLQWPEEGAAFSAGHTLSWGRLSHPYFSFRTVEKVTAFTTLLPLEVFLEHLKKKKRRLVMLVNLSQLLLVKTILLIVLVPFIIL